MPLPKPRKNEEQDEFISRCMSAVKDEFSDQKQRLAVCFNQWRSKDKQVASFRYLASVGKPWQYQGKWYTKLRLIDANETSLPSQPKGVRWRVTYEALKKAIQRLLASKNMPLVGPPEEGHDATEQVGEFQDLIMPDGYADITYEVTDPKAIEGLKSGEWQAVSPEVNARSKHIDEHGVVVLDDFDFERLAFVDKGAFPRDLVESFWQADMLHRLSAELQLNGHASTPPTLGEGSGLMTDGAGTRISPDRDGGRQLADKTKETQNGGISLSNEKPPDSETYLGADAWNTADAPDKFFAYVPEGGNPSDRKLPLASVQKKDVDEAIVRNALARFSQTDLPSGAKAPALAKICRVAGRLGIESELCQEREGEKGGINMTTETKPEDQIKELQAQIEKLQGELAKEKQRVEIVEKSHKPPEAWKAEFDGLKAEVQNLREERQERLTAERASKIDKLVDLRIRGNLVSEVARADESKKYDKLQAEALDLMIADAEVQAAQVESGGPRAKFYASRQNQTLDIINAVRVRQGLQPLEKEYNQ